MSKSGVELGTSDEAKSLSSTRKVSRVFSMLDFVLRIIGIVGTIASAMTMGTTTESLPFFTRFIRFQAEFDDLPTLTLFVIINGIVCGYLLISLAFSILHIVRSAAQKTRIVLIILDAIMLSVLTAGASASTTIVYVAHQGNSNANWFAICQQFNSFCERISGALVGSFIVVAMFLIIIFLSAVAITRQR